MHLPGSNGSNIVYSVLGTSSNDQRSFDCHMPGGCMANLRIPDDTPEATVNYLKDNSNFFNEKVVIVEGPVIWDSVIGAFRCISLSLP